MKIVRSTWIAVVPRALPLILILPALALPACCKSTRKALPDSWVGPLWEKQSEITVTGDRWGHTVTVLPTGEIFVAGGYLGDEITASTEIRGSEGEDPVPGPPLPEPRAHHSATLLEDGTLILAGGLVAPDLAPTESVLRYDPTSGALTLDSSALREPRAFHTATLLEDGVILLEGGEPPEAEVFRPGNE